MDILVGKIVKAQGLKGEVKLACSLDEPSQLSKIKYLSVGDKRLTVENINCQSTFAIIKFQGFSDKKQAESLSGWEVYADRADIPLPAGRYFIEEILGSKVFLDDGFLLGEVIDVVTNVGRADIFTVKKGDVIMRFPFLKEMIIEVDIQDGRIVLLGTRLKEVCVYED